MDSYEARLKSFKYWTGTEDPCQLALVGFYYTGFSDLIKCYYCKYDAYNFFTGTENTLQDHKRYSPDCPFYELNTTNYQNTRFTSPRVVNNNYELLTPFTCDNYTLMENRMKSFLHFPSILKPIVNNLCEAGFYYTNIGDAVCCYVCKIIATNWCPTSNAWYVHKILNQKCPLIGFKDLNITYTENLDNNVKLAATAPAYEINHFNIPKCLQCKTNTVDSVMLPCYHLSTCKECALTCTQCNVCNVFTGGFFIIKIPIDALNLVEHDRVRV